jgi:hypothetical protein
MALRRGWPLFWFDLHMLWSELVISTEPDGTDSAAFDQWAALIEPWCERAGVVDPWLVSVCLETMIWWTLNPDDPNTRLSEGYPWFRFTQFETRKAGVPLTEGTVPKFAPTFSDAYPTSETTGEMIQQILYGDQKEAPARLEAANPESLDAFANRMRNDFDRQLRAYLKTMREQFNFESRPQESEHADWTVAAFAGMSYREAAQIFQDKNGYPDQSTFSKAVTRFSQRIALTLPGYRAPTDRVTARLTLGESWG